MSATNFYQTLYQNEQLFRVAGESWTVESGLPTAAEPEDEQPVDTSVLLELTDENVLPDTLDLLAELDVLAAAPISYPVELLIDDPLIDSTVAIIPEPEPVALVITAPEPLPEAAPRPTTPSIVPPIQQVRMTQLNHKVLLLADEELDPSNLLFLEKILKAVNLNIDGVDLLNLHGAGDLNFAELVQDKKIHHFITFGVPFSRINLDIAMDRYQPIRFFGITFLMADSLPTIEADQNLKKRLWGSLQRVFLKQ